MAEFARAFRRQRAPLGLIIGFQVSNRFPAMRLTRMSSPSPLAIDLREKRFATAIPDIRCHIRV
jgi:hypothetical protein